MADALDHIAETLTQCRHRQPAVLQRQSQEGTDGQRHQMPRNPGYPPWPDNQNGQAGDADNPVPQPSAGQRENQYTQLFDVVLCLAGGVQAQQILQLQGGNDNADPGGKAQGDRVRNVLNQPPGPNQPQGNEDDPGKHGAKQQAAQAILLGDGQQDDHERGGRPTDIETRTASQGDQGRGDQYRIQPLLGRYTYGNRQGHGQRDGDNPYRHSGTDVAA